MTSIRKLSIEDFKTIKSILNRHNISSDRIIIDFKMIKIKQHLKKLKGTLHLETKLATVEV